MKYIHLFLIAIVCATASCSRERVTGELIDTAQAEYYARQFDDARKTLETAVGDSARFESLDSRRLCQAANLSLLIDSALAAGTGHEGAEADAVAARCLARARQLNADTVDAYIARLPHEQALRLAVIDRVSTYLAIPRDSLVVEENDTVQ